MFENFQTENKLRPSFASQLLGTFPLRGRHEEADCFYAGKRKRKKIKKNL